MSENTPKKKAPAEERVIRVVHVFGVNLGSYVLGLASLVAFFIAFIDLVGVLAIFAGVNAETLQSTLGRFGFESKPIVLILVDIIDRAILASIFLIFAFGLKSVFLGTRYEVVAFDITDIDTLKQYLVGLVITLIGTRFLERVLAGVETQSTILGFGVGVGIAVTALALYVLVLKWQRKDKNIGS
jgi:uncharacterized membrane protein YqhA